MDLVQHLRDCLIKEAPSFHWKIKGSPVCVRAEGGAEVPESLEVQAYSSGLKQGGASFRLPGKLLLRWGASELARLILLGACLKKTGHGDEYAEGR